MVTARASLESDALDAFNTETVLERAGVADADTDQRSTHAWRSRIGAVLKSLVIMLTGVALGAGGLWAYQIRTTTPAPATLSLQTTPSGAEVILDGTPSGVTPASMVLAAGNYHLRLVGANGRTRELEVALQPGSSVVRQVEWAETPSSAPPSGTLHIETEPPGQTVLVDDTARGTSPLTVPDLPVGEHQVVVASAEASLARRVKIAAGETLSLVFAPGSRTGSAGWLRVISPVPLQLYTNGKLVGNTDTERLMLSAGDHEMEMINDTLGFVSKQRVRVVAGKTSDVRVLPPNGALSINALPWADVWVNNERVGETPIANLSRRIGTHDVVLRHPQFGERRLQVTVSLKQTARVGVDMRQP
jgi:hypothetical protein